MPWYVIEDNESEFASWFLMVRQIYDYKYFEIIDAEVHARNRKNTSVFLLKIIAVYEFQKLSSIIWSWLWFGSKQHNVLADWVRY